MKALIAVATLTSSFALWAVRPIPANEVITPLLESGKELTSLVEMQNLGLNSGETSLDLWSGSYWPQYQGFLGVRYRDPSFIKLMSEEAQYGEYKEAMDKSPLATYIGKEDLLSPAEKYDLVVGDSAMTLTKYSWDLGGRWAVLGHVPTWRGICDGWSAASQMMPRPTKTVVLNTPQGRPIKFFPEDIKALGSLLYSRAQENVIFLGKRCVSNALNMFSDACDGTNPGALHKALVNRVGHMKKSFVADVSPTSEVWNYPVKSYKISFYNVFTEEESEKFEDSMELFTKKAHFAKSSVRHKNTYAIVGVKAVVTYANMRPANLLAVDGKESDLTMEKTYWYDLELDRNFNVLGGEWFGNEMPDFIWAPNDLMYPPSESEVNRLPVTPAEITAAAKISSKSGQPLSVIVQKLFETSK